MSAWLKAPSESSTAFATYLARDRPQDFGCRPCQFLARAGALRPEQDQRRTTAEAVHHVLPIANRTCTLGSFARNIESRALIGARIGRLPALQLASRETDSPDEMLRFLGEIETLQVAQKAPVGETVIQKFQILNMLGQVDEARNYMQQSLTKYRNDPVLISFIQRLNQQMQNQALGMDEGAMLQRMSSRRMNRKSSHNRACSSRSGNRTRTGQEQALATGHLRLDSGCAQLIDAQLRPRFKVCAIGQQFIQANPTAADHFTFASPRPRALQR